MDPTCSSESIYNLIPSDFKEPPQLPRYISIFKTSVKDDMQKVKTAMKTMGPAKLELPSPKDFLKKHSKEKTLPPMGSWYFVSHNLLRTLENPKMEIEDFNTLDPVISSEPSLILEGKKFDRNEPKKPPVPLRTDHPIMGIQSGKNFINTNAADAIMGVAKRPKPIYVDKRTGDKHDLEFSGLVPKYINKKDYGVTPEYICKRNEEVKKAQEEYDDYIQENLRKASMKRLSDEEREAVLQGLKKNWEEVHKEFQSLSVFIDSIPKKIRKQKLEKEMKQLEHDIGVIEKHKVIYIANK